MTRTRSFIASDNLGAPCFCLECQAANVTTLPIVRVPPDEFCSRPRWLHGEELKRYYEARDLALSQVKAIVGAKA